MHFKVIYTGIDHPNHINALDKFALGMQANGDTVECHEALNREPDGYVIFGSWKNRDQPHHNAKRAVVASGKPFVVIETPIFGRKPVNVFVQDDCFRVGLNGFLNNRGAFVKDKPRIWNDETAEAWDPSRKDMMCERLGVELSRDQNTQGPIILALQLPGDASLEGQDISEWFERWVHTLKGETEKFVRFPQLPREYDKSVLQKAVDSGWRLQQGSHENLVSTLKKCRLSISYSSGFGVDSIIAGTPAITDSDASFAWEISHKAKDGMQNPYFPSFDQRQNWLSRLAYHQWFVEEMESGACWAHLKSLMN
jgi:hypothetical protein